MIQTLISFKPSAIEVALSNQIKHTIFHWMLIKALQEWSFALDIDVDILSRSLPYYNQE